MKCLDIFGVFEHSKIPNDSRTDPFLPMEKTLLTKKTTLSSLKTSEKQSLQQSEEVNQRKFVSSKMKVQTMAVKIAWSSQTTYFSRNKLPFSILYKDLMTFFAGIIVCNLFKKIECQIKPAANLKILNVTPSWFVLFPGFHIITFPRFVSNLWFGSPGFKY